MKEQDKTSGKEINEMEIIYLIEFKVMVICSPNSEEK